MYLPETLNYILFGYYPYLCLTVFLAGSLLRFEREQYTWRAASSQILRKKQLQYGSILFHVSILFLFFGHLIGLLTPHAVYSPFISPENKQWIAIITGGLAGAVCFVGLSMLVHVWSAPFGFLLRRGWQITRTNRRGARVSL